jgi:hypothetical protein
MRRHTTETLAKHIDCLASLATRVPGAPWLSRPLFALLLSFQANAQVIHFITVIVAVLSAQYLFVIIERIILLDFGGHVCERA